MRVPDGLKYTRDHEWVRVEGDTATVGITDFAQHALGDITFVELPQVGRAVRQREELGVVESVKAASDVYAPLAGTVIETNGALPDAPEWINQDPYGRGWICRLGRIETAGLSALLDAAEYRRHIGEKP